MRISDWSSDVCSSDLKTFQAIELGYSEASRAIFDANVTNVIAASLMFWFGSGPIKGFAVVQIGRASCRESVSVRVDLGGRRIIKNKKYTTKMTQYIQLLEIYITKQHITQNSTR